VIPQPPDPALIDAAVQDALGTWGRESTQLLQVLRHAQEPLGYLPPPRSSASRPNSPCPSPACAA